MDLKFRASIGVYQCRERDRRFLKLGGRWGEDATLRHDDACYFFLEGSDGEIARLAHPELPEACLGMVEGRPTGASRDKGRPTGASRDKRNWKVGQFRLS